MTKLRVLHASPTWFSPTSVVGGGERWVDNVRLALSAGAPEIEQAMVAIGEEPEVSLRGQSLVRVLPNQRGLRTPMDAVSSYLWREFENFDVVHVHQSLTDFGAYACCVAASLGKTVVLTDLGGGASPIMLQGGLAMADGIVSISRYAHAMIASSVRSDSLIISGPIDTDKFVPAATKPANPSAICVSRIMPHKGIDRLIKALPAGLKLKVVGRVYHDAYRAFLGELARGKDVEFIHDAQDDDLLGLYQSSSVFLQASCITDVYGSVQLKTELMGLTTLEAMSCGLPVVVSSDGGSLPELVTDAQFGAVFTNQDELQSLLTRHMAGFWPVTTASSAARAHVIQAAGLVGYGQRLGTFYAKVHAQKIKSLQGKSVAHSYSQ